MFGWGSKKKRLKQARVAILAADGVEQSQLDTTVKALRKAQADPYIISLREGKVQAQRALKSTKKIPVDVTIDEVHPASFAALVIPGGTQHAERLRLNDRVREFVRAFDRNKKPIAAYGHGVAVLASAGVLPGKHLTGWPSIRDDITNAGGIWTDEPYVTDDNLLTSRNSHDVDKNTSKIIKHLGGQIRDWSKVES